MKIRPAKIEDIDPLMEITRRCIKNLDSNRIYQWDEIYPSRTDYNEDIAEHSLYVIIVDLKDSISGCICINEIVYPGYEDAEWSGSDFLVIHKMIIDPMFENRGYGRFAMDYAEQTACSMRKDSIRLDCFQKNRRANMFYQGLGYVRRGETLFRKGMFNLYEKII